jgi:hypothetical protein
MGCGQISAKPIKLTTDEKLDKLQLTVESLIAEKHADEKKITDYNSCLDTCETLYPWYETTEDITQVERNIKNQKRFECIKECEKSMPAIAKINEC